MLDDRIVSDVSEAAVKRRINSDCSWSSRVVKNTNTGNVTSCRRFVSSIALVVMSVMLTAPTIVNAQNITLTPVEGDDYTDVCMEFQITQAVFEAILESGGTPIEATTRASDARVRAALAVQRSIRDEDVVDAIDAIDAAYDALAKVHRLLAEKLLNKFERETFVTERGFYPPATRVDSAILAIVDARYGTLEAACHLGITRINR